MTRTKLVITGLFLVFLSISFYNSASAFPEGPPPARTRAPGEGDCLICHFSFPINDPSGGMVFNDLPKAYTPGEPIVFSLTVFQDGTGGVRKDWGFELTVLDENNQFVGTI